MNFFRARSDGSALTFGGFTVPLTDAVGAQLRRREGEMLVGLRPEYFSDARTEGGGVGEVSVTVEVMEQLGSETLVYFRIDGDAELTSGDSEAALGGAFVARLDPRTRPLPGERLQLAVDVERAHFFDPDNGATLRIDGV